MLNAFAHAEDLHGSMNPTEVMTITRVAALHFYRHWQQAPDCLDSDGSLLAIFDKTDITSRLPSMDKRSLSLFQLVDESFNSMRTSRLT